MNEAISMLPHVILCTCCNAVRACLPLKFAIKQVMRNKSRFPLDPCLSAGCNSSSQMGLFLKMLHAAATAMETDGLDYDIPGE